MTDFEKNWAGYKYPAMLRDSIRKAEKWDMQYPVNRRELLRLRLSYWLWWKWAPIPAALIGMGIGAGLAFLIAGWLL